MSKYTHLTLGETEDDAIGVLDDPFGQNPSSGNFFKESALEEVVMVRGFIKVSP